jgi:hypothetical protein
MQCCNMLLHSRGSSPWACRGGSGWQACAHILRTGLCQGLADGLGSATAASLGLREGLCRSTQNDQGVQCESFDDVKTDAVAQAV